VLAAKVNVDDLVAGPAAIRHVSRFLRSFEGEINPYSNSR